MSWLLWIPVWIVLGLLGLALLLLLVPTWIRASGSVNGLEADGEMTAGWGYFVVRVRASVEGGLVMRLLGIPVYRRTWAQLAKSKGASEVQEKANPKKKAPKADAPSSGAKSAPGPGLRGLFRVARVLWNAALRLLRTLHFSGWVRGQFGLDDPADTAQVALFLGAVRRIAPSANVQVTPNWMEEVLELEGEVSLVFWPIQTALVAGLIFINREFRTTMSAITR